MGNSKLLITIFGLVISTQLLISEVSAADNISYIGAVVEYYPVNSGTNATTISVANANNYVTIIRTAWGYSTDIIVFPEGSLTTGLTFSSTNRSLYPSFSSIIPEPNTDIPCDNTTTVVIEALRLISCAAKSYSMYVVVNLNEMVNCTTTGTTSYPCPRDGYFFYNTNVVFNRTGGIISKYRKFNLFGEAGFNVTQTPVIANFTTDFNVTFGHFICFDLLFKTPALTLVNDYNITNFLYPIHWFSELPYLTSNQAQSAWAYANNVNLLASAYNTPASGSGGSGIFIGTSGTLISIFPETAKNALLVGRIPIVINGTRTYIAPTTTYPLIYEFSNAEITTLVNINTVDQQVLLRDNLDPYTTRSLTLANGTTSTSLDLCDRGFCCSFSIRTTFNETNVNSSVNYYRYRIAVFNGMRTHSGLATTGQQICSIISCINDTINGCGIRFNASATVVQPTVFNNILISGNFSKTNDTLQIPNSLTSNILPLNASYYTFTNTYYNNVSFANVTFNLTTGVNNLLTFAIYGRNFSGDGLPETIADNAIQSSAISLSRFSQTTTFFLVAIVTSFVMLKK